MPILQPNHRLESSEVGDSWSGLERVRSSVGDSVENSLSSTGVLDENKAQALNVLIKLAWEFADAIESDNESVIVNAKENLYRFVRDNPDHIFLLFRRLFDLSHDKAISLPDWYGSDLGALSTYWIQLVRIVSHGSSESDRSHMYNQVPVFKILLERFRDIYIPKLESAMQTD